MGRGSATPASPSSRAAASGPTVWPRGSPRSRSAGSPSGATGASGSGTAEGLAVLGGDGPLSGRSAPATRAPTTPGVRRRPMTSSRTRAGALWLGTDPRRPRRPPRSGRGPRPHRNRPRAGRPAGPRPRVGRDRDGRALPLWAPTAGWSVTLPRPTASSRGRPTPSKSAPWGPGLESAPSLGQCVVDPGGQALTCLGEADGYVDGRTGALLTDREGRDLDVELRRRGLPLHRVPRPRTTCSYHLDSDPRPDLRQRVGGSAWPGTGRSSRRTLRGSPAWPAAGPPRYTADRGLPGPAPHRHRPRRPTAGLWVATRGGLVRYRDGRAHPGPRGPRSPRATCTPT